ncbi:MAG: hypothetical protein ACK5WZ_00145 [Pseudobdellovibrionaceae bacterium]
MKTKLRFYMLVLMYTFTMAAPIAFAATEKIAGTQKRSPSSSQEFTFKYHYKSDKLEIKTKSNTWEEAYQLASQQCFSKFTKNKKLNYDIGMDVVDVCANPR